MKGQIWVPNENICDFHLRLLAISIVCTYTCVQFLELQIRKQKNVRETRNTLVVIDLKEQIEVTM